MSVPANLQAQPVDPALLERVEVALCRLRAGGPVVIGPLAKGGGLAVRALEMAPADAAFAAGSRLVLPGALATPPTWCNRVISPGPSITPRAVVDWILEASHRDELARLLASGAAGEPLHAAAIELCKLAGLLPAAIVDPAVDLALGLAEPASQSMRLDIEDVLGFREAQARSVRPVVEARMPLRGIRDTRLVAFRAGPSAVEHVAIVIGDLVPEADTPPLCRLHSACFTGDIFGSMRCDCGEQLQGAIDRIAAEGSGIILYLAQEGRGIGLVNKLRAYRLQDAGLDTVEANEHLGFMADERDWLMAALMLEQLSIRRVRLLTNNPTKVTTLQRHGIDVVERVPHAFAANPHNHGYLATKAAKSGHMLELPAVQPRRSAGSQQ